jgi:iron complex outermembrane receptor protein
MREHWRVVAGVGVTYLAMAGASAQTLEEVTVTAQKREQNLQDVGISIAAVSGESIRELALTNSVDAIVKLPSVLNYSAYGPGSSANIVIRGVGLNDFAEGHEAPVTAYVDEFYLVSVPAIGFSMMDLARVEVLRGPQGTLFGRNSTGGLVHFVSARPTQTPEGFLELTGGRFGEYKIEGALSGGITERLSGRLSVLSHHSDGYLRNVNPAFGDAGQAGTDAIRGQLLWQTESGWDVLLKAEYGELDTRHLYYQQVPAVPDPARGGVFVRDPGGTDFAGYNEARFAGGAARGSLVANTNFPSYLKSDSSTFLLKVDKDIGDVTFTSISGYLDLSRDLSEDCDASPNDICSATFPYSTQTFTQELRLVRETGSTRWTTGVYFLDATADNRPNATFNVPLDGPEAVDLATGLYNGDIFPVALSADWTLDTKSYSIFGQIEQDLSDQLTLIAGVRVTRDEKDFLDRDNASLRDCAGGDPNCFTDYTPVPYKGTYKQTLYSGKLQLDWRPMDDVLIYGSYSRGSKAGGFNNGFYPTAIPFEEIPYGDEVVNAYEIGAKTMLAGGRVRLNSSAFFYDYKDFQTFNFTGFGGVIVNRDATSKGIEAEIEASLSQSLTAKLGVAWLDTEIKDVTLRDAVTVRDAPMAMAPEYSVSGSLRYAVPVGANGELSLLWDFNYVDSYVTNNFDEPAAWVDGYFVHNARIGYQINEHWQVAALVNNISDRRVVTRVFVFDSLGYAQDMYTQPRTWAAQLTYRW